MILVVDGNVSVCEDLEYALSTAGFEACSTTSATLALGMLELGAVEAIVADFRVQHRSGVWLLQRVDEMYPNTLRILTTDDPRIECSRLRNHGVCHLYLRKPYVVAHLCRMLSESGVPQRALAVS